MAEHVRVVEVSPRDGLQNEAAFIATADKLELIRRLAASGLRSIEATAFVSPKWVPQMADAAELFPQLPRDGGRRYPVLVPNLQGYERAVACGVREVAVFTAASEAFTRKNINAGIEESLQRFEPVLERARADGVAVRGYVSTVLGCPYQGAVPVSDVVRVAARLHAMGCYEISLGDTIGVGTAGAARAMLQAVAGDIPMAALAVHFHPFAPGAAGNLATEDLVWLAHASGHETGVDLPALLGVIEEFGRRLGRPLGGRSHAWLRQHFGLSPTGATLHRTP